MAKLDSLMNSIPCVSCLGSGRSLIAGAPLNVFRVMIDPTVEDLANSRKWVTCRRCKGTGVEPGLFRCSNCGEMSAAKEDDLCKACFNDAAFVDVKIFQRDREERRAAKRLSVINELRAIEESLR